MFKALLKKEILNNLYNQRYVITLVLMVVLVGLSVWSIERTHRIHLRNYADAALGFDEAAKASKQVWQFMSAGITTEKKPGALAVLGPGLDDEMTRSLSYSGWNEVEIGPPKLFSPLFRMFTSPDYIYIINIICSLLALLFVYDAVCGEKEQGTLRLTLTYPLPRDLVLLAKWVGGVLSLCIPLALATLGAWIFLYLTPTFEITMDHAVRFLLIFLVSVLYLSTFFTLGLLVSCLTPRPTTSLMLCLFLWIVFVLGIPNLMPMIARSVRPIPSEGKIAAEKDQKSWETMRWVEKNLRSQIHDEDEYRESGQRLVAKALEGIDQFRRNRVQEQIALARNLARISPSACYAYAASDLAQTGIGSFAKFQRYVIWYRHLFNEIKDRLIAVYRQEAHGKNTWWGGMQFEPKDLGLIPRFRPLDVPFTDSLAAALPDIGLLLAFNAVFFLGAYAAFLSYDVR
jgi:ABC-2 type transport system permease protein